MHRTSASGGTSGMAGHVTPWVQGMTVRYLGSRPAVQGWYVDVTPAVLDVTVENADPEMLPGGYTMTVKLDRVLLPECRAYYDDPFWGGVHPESETLRELGLDWRSYINKYHRAKLYATWDWDDGTQYIELPDGYAEQALMLLFDGYVWSLSPDAPGYGKMPLTVEFRSPIVRLQKPAGLVDSRFGPLDHILVGKINTLPRGEAPRLYGWECVQYILQQVLGGEWASKLVSRFPPWPNFDFEHYDLLNYRMLFDPPMSAPFMFPPPFGRSALDWIKEFAQTDFAVFTFVLNWANPTAGPVPIYGWYYSLVAMAPTVPIYDVGANAASATAGWQQLPEQDFNQVQVWGKLPNDAGDLAGLMPALPSMSGMTNIVGSAIPEQLADRTWERTKLMQGPHFWVPGVAQAVSWLTALRHRNLDPRRVTFTLRGDPWWWWGTKVVPDFSGPQSDPDLFEAGETFRIMRVKHHIDCVKHTWETTLNCAAENDPWT
jgi:hypothetical protein